MRQMLKNMFHPLLIALMCYELLAVIYMEYAGVPTFIQWIALAIPWIQLCIYLVRKEKQGMFDKEDSDGIE